MTRCRVGILVLGCLSGWAGCNGPASIDVEPQQPLLSSTSERLQLHATVKGKDGKVLGGVPVHFSSLTPTMLTVDDVGNLQAVTSGTGTVLVAAGKLSKQVDVLIQIPKRISIATTSPMPLMLGVSTGFKATVYDDRKQPMIAGEMRWSSSDPEIFTVDDRGNVKPNKEGEATLTVFAAGIQGTMKVVVKHEELHEDGSLGQ
jgi:hypothetical protein